MMRGGARVKLNDDDAQDDRATNETNAARNYNANERLNGMLCKRESEQRAR